jgi:chromosome segregation ATPase
LYNELERLRKEGKRNQDEIRRLSEAKIDDIVVESKPALPARNAEAEATISMLKQELEDANQAIKDLKETLKTTMEERDTVSPSKSHQPHSMSMSGDSNGGMPLFYAMEKQAELTQARDEIARLASLLGDAESTKQEALENMEEMKLLMEDAQSRLKRQEQLQTNPDKERVNLEYLKNIMLSYLNAKTAAEKKTLLPVLGTVLCLTPEEQRKAMDALDKGGAASVVDSVATTVLNLKWS